MRCKSSNNFMRLEMLGIAAIFFVMDMKCFSLLKEKGDLECVICFLTVMMY